MTPPNAIGVDQLRKLSERFWSKVNRAEPDACWLWESATNQNGYGTFSMGGREGRPEFAHRVAWMLCMGPIPEGLVLDHLCRVPGCVNPSHLEPVTHRENCARGVAAEVNAARQLSITHCPQGHPYDDANTYRHPQGCRKCRACAAEQARAKRAQS